MSCQKKENQTENREVTRRKFLHVAGTVILFAGTGCTFSAGQNISPELKRLLENSKFAPSDGYILVDTNKCQGCVSCMLACSLVHEGVESQSLARIQIMQNSFKPFPEDLTIEQCRQCVNPACVEECPENALTVNAEFGNVRMVDAVKCIGCGTCIEACPFTPSRPIVVEDDLFDGDFKSRKCDLCANTPYHWDDKGGGPDGKQACVEVCPVKAIQFTRTIPVQEGDEGYKVNLRGRSWMMLGYPTT
jgi:protein NrfC